MDKGTEIETATEVLRNLYRAGIWGHLYVMLGFPGETDKESQLTIDYLLSHKDIIRSFHVEDFVLSKESIVHRYPERFGVEILQDNTDTDFNANVPFRASFGITQSEGAKLATSVMDGAANELFGDRLLNMISHFYLPLYLSHYQNIDLLLKSAPWRKTTQTPRHFLITSDSSPKLKRGVVLNKLNFNLIDMRRQIEQGSDLIANPEEAWVIFNAETGAIKVIREQSAEILLLGQSGKAVSNIARLLANKYDASISIIEKYTLEFYKALQKEGYLS